MARARFWRAGSAGAPPYRGLEPAQTLQLTGTCVAAVDVGRDDEHGRHVALGVDVALDDGQHLVARRLGRVHAQMQPGS